MRIKFGYAIFLLLASCTTNQGNVDNPEKLIDSVVDLNCDGISGVYRNKGKVSKDSENRFVNLSDLLFGFFPLQAEIEFIKLQKLDTAQIQIELMGNQEDSVAQSRKLDYECRNGWIKFEVSTSGYVDGTSTKDNSSIAMKYFVNSKKLVVYDTYFVESTSLFIIKQKKSGQHVYEFVRRD